MKKARCSDAQIMGILKQAESGVPVSELCREHGMSSASFYKWRAKFGGMDASMMSDMKALAVRQLLQPICDLGVLITQPASEVVLQNRTVC